MSTLKVNKLTNVACDDTTGVEIDLPIKLKLNVIKLLLQMPSEHLSISARILFVLSVLTNQAITGNKLNMWFGWDLRLCYCKSCNEYQLNK